MYPGQEVVCIKDEGSRGLLTKNTEYIVLATRMPLCGCRDRKDPNAFQVNVGIINPTGMGLCTTCGSIDKEQHVWFNSKRFAPVDSLSDNITNYQETVNAQPFTITPLPSHV